MKTIRESLLEALDKEKALTPEELLKMYSKQYPAITQEEAVEIHNLWLDAVLAPKDSDFLKIFKKYKKRLKEIESGS